jgi:hypothetical protein
MGDVATRTAAHQDLQAHLGVRVEQRHARPGSAARIAAVRPAAPAPMTEM